MTLVLQLRAGLRRSGWLLLGLLLPALALASPLEGRWQLRATPNSAPEVIQHLPLSGGRFEFIASVELADGGRRVLDFNNSSVIGRFQHELRDERGVLVARLEGGLQSKAPNPYFLRHGRTLQLPAGRYALHTQIETPFLLGQPQVFITDEAEYLAAIKPGNAFTLVCLGLFIGLGFFYGTLALFRRRWVEGCYALFILVPLIVSWFVSQETHLPPASQPPRPVLTAFPVWFWIGAVLTVVFLAIMFGRVLPWAYYASSPLFWVLWLGHTAVLMGLLQRLRIWTPIAALAEGNWTPAVLVALGSLFNGFFWEFWNWGSAHPDPSFATNPNYWVYNIPYVNVIHLFAEMPLLGFAGYLPFGILVWLVFIWAGQLCGFDTSLDLDD